MKKIFLLVIILLVSTNCFGQAITCVAPAVNLLTYSDDMTSSTGWTKTATMTDDTATTTPPEGIYNINKTFKAASGASQTTLLLGASLAAHVINNNNYKVSVYVKYSNLQYLAVGFTGSGTYLQAFDIQNGAVGTTNAFTNGAITAVGNSWYRITFTYTGATSLSPAFRMVFKPLNSNVYSDTKTTAGTEVVYLTAPQVQPASSRVDQYIPTTAAFKAWGSPVCPVQISPYTTTNSN
jgi:hypothetical protein